MNADVLTRESKYSTAVVPGERTGRDSLEALVADHLRSMAALATEYADAQSAAVVTAMELIAGSLGSGGKVLACGNGGSAADSQHFVAELIGRVSYERVPFSAISLTGDSAVLTAIGNDYGYEELFARQLRGLGRLGDVLVVMSTSGRSKNVVQAVAAAREMGLPVISFTGPSPHLSLELADAWLRVASPETTHIQELHSALVHTICLGVERILHRDGLTS